MWWWIIRNQDQTSPAGAGLNDPSGEGYPYIYADNTLTHIKLT